MKIYFVYIEAGQVEPDFLISGCGQVGKGLVKGAAVKIFLPHRKLVGKVDPDLGKHGGQRVQQLALSGVNIKFNLTGIDFYEQVTLIKRLPGAKQQVAALQGAGDLAVEDDGLG